MSLIAQWILDASREDLETILVWYDPATGINPLRRSKGDYPSVVCVSQPASAYSDDELREIVAFACEATAASDALGSRMGANLFVIEKDTDSVIARRMTWQYPVFLSSVAEAISFFRSRSTEPLERNDVRLEAFDREHSALAEPRP